MSQEVIEINIKDLVLWTENPRDPISPNAKDQDVVNKALEDKYSKWTLAKLAKDMGDYYDFSELPTVVYHGSKPIVYDGNRRMILAKLKHRLVSYEGSDEINIPDIPAVIPCNVCSKDIALKNVYRKHSDSGSWQPLERDMFLHKFMKEEKSPFLIIEESTSLISTNPHLNQRFVKEEIFREDILEELGIDVKSDKLKSVYDSEDLAKILMDISQKVKNKNVTTRNNRGKIIDVLDKSSLRLINRNKGERYKPAKIDFKQSIDFEQNNNTRQTRRTINKDSEIFGSKLILIPGEVNSLYRDICDLYSFYLKNKGQLSASFPNIIRMSLRLLCETAARDVSSTGIDAYLRAHFANAKKVLNQDVKTMLSTQNVTDSSIVQLLHVGAHSYQHSSNLPQTLAISFILGEILKITHGKKEK